MSRQKMQAERILGLMLAFLFLTACAPPAAPVPPTTTPMPAPPIAESPTVVPAPTVIPTQTAQLPIGLFDSAEHPGWTQRYSADGTLVVYKSGVKYITGKWYVENGIFHTGDSYCGDYDRMLASYRWQFDGQVLTFQVVKDQCPDRREMMDGVPWKLTE